jgi:hypothetical protein
MYGIWRGVSARAWTKESATLLWGVWRSQNLEAVPGPNPAQSPLDGPRWSLIATEGLRLRSVVNLAVGWDRSLATPHAPSTSALRTWSMVRHSRWVRIPLTPEDRYYVRDPRAGRFCLPRATTYPLPDGPDDPYGDRCAVRRGSRDDPRPGLICRILVLAN